MSELKYLAGYPPDLVAEAARRLADGSLAKALAARYPGRHDIRTHEALYRYAQELKQRHLRRAPPLAKVLYDERLEAVEFALGLNTRRSRLQGARLTTKREIRIAGLFRELAPEFLRMVVVHELAHLKEVEHDAGFYRLCRAMEPDYERFELDLRLTLTVRDQGAPAGGPEAPPEPHPSHP